MRKRSFDYPKGLEEHLREGVRVIRSGNAYYLYAGYPKRDSVSGKFVSVPGSSIGKYTEKDGFIPADQMRQREIIAPAVSENAAGTLIPSVSEPELLKDLMLPGSGASFWPILSKTPVSEKPSENYKGCKRAQLRRNQKEEEKRRKMLHKSEQELQTLTKKLRESEGNETDEKILCQIRSCMERFGENPFASYVLYIVDSIIDEMLADDSGKEMYFTSVSDFTRDRKLSLAEVVRFLMTCGAMSADRALFRQFSSENNIPTASALIQQRAKLKPEGMRHLFCRIVERISPPVLRLYKGEYRILAIDGSDTNISYDKDADSFVRMGDTGYNQFHVNCIYDVLNQSYCNVLIQPKGKTNEPQAACQMIRGMELKEKAIYMGDRGYGSLNLFETIRRTENAEFLIRVKEDYIKEIKALKLEEQDTTIRFTVVTRQTKENKEKIHQGGYKYLSGKSIFGKNKKSVEWEFEDETAVELRVVRFRLSSGKWETLITSLPKEEFSTNDLKELYSLRYEIEYSFRYLKYALAMSFYHSRKEDFNKQEIYASLCAYNICSTIIGYAARMGSLDKNNELQQMEAVENVSECRWTENKEEGNQHGYRINCTMGIYIVIDFIRNRGNVAYDICEMIRRYKVPVRRNRNFRRNTKPHSWISFFYRAS